MDKNEYLNTKLKPIMENMLFQLCNELPEDPVKFMINWLQKTGGFCDNGLTEEEDKELKELREEMKKYKEKEKKEKKKK